MEGSRSSESSELLVPTCRVRVAALCCDLGEDGLGSQHAALHGCVGAFDLGDVHEAGAAANQEPSREGQLRDGLERQSRAEREQL